MELENLVNNYINSNANKYPYNNKEFHYETMLQRLNLDDKRKDTIIRGKGFVINKSQSKIKKDLKDPDSILSTRFGQGVQDVNAFGNRYSCTCGHLQQKINDGIECPICHTKVKYVDDDFEYYGWIVLQDHWVIHPNLYKSLEFFIGKKELPKILEITDEKDIDGHSINKKYKNDKKYESDSPYIGIGMIEFYNKFDEIMTYYREKNRKKTKAKEQYYDDIYLNRDKIFTQSIPVYTLLLRPVKLEGKTFTYEGTNSLYNMMVSLATQINNNKLKINRKLKPKNQLLFDLQMKMQELYEEIIKLLKGKKGAIRELFGGRYQFTARDVIISDPELRIDQISLSYYTLVELLQQTIINVLQKIYNFSYDQSYNIWYQSQINIDPRVVHIIEGLMKNGRGIPILLNRNPTISYQSIIQMFVVKINYNYTIGTPLNILPGLAADFDGDVLNVMYIINKEFFEACNRVFNPRNAMQISRNDGKLNNDIIWTKDTLINANALIYLSRNKYTQDQLSRIEQAKKLE